MGPYNDSSSFFLQGKLQDNNQREWLIHNTHTSPLTQLIFLWPSSHLYSQIDVSKTFKSVIPREP